MTGPQNTDTHTHTLTYSHAHNDLIRHRHSSLSTLRTETSPPQPFLALAPSCTVPWAKNGHPPDAYHCVCSAFCWPGSLAIVWPCPSTPSSPSMSSPRLTRSQAP
eukprot:EG_transcript_52333